MDHTCYIRRFIYFINCAWICVHSSSQFVQIFYHKSWSWKVSFLLVTEAMCPFNLPFLGKVWITSWILVMCSFNFSFWLKFRSLHELLICVHSSSLLTKVWIAHFTLKGLFTSWTADMCPFKFPLCLNLLSQILQLVGFFSSWTEAIGPFYLPFWVKFGLIHELPICVLSSSLFD